MKYFKLLPLALAMIPVSHAFASSSKADLMPVLKQVDHIIYSLHADKPGQARVRAIDGSEYTAGQALWLKGQLHAAEVAAVQGDQLQASNEIRQIASILKGHGAQIDTDTLFARYSQAN